LASKTKQPARSLSSNNSPLPKGWRMVRFGDVVRNVKEKVDRENTDLTRYIAGEHMYSEDIHLRCWGELNGDYLGPAFHRRFRKGQVLYGSRRTYLKKVAVASFDGITANTTFVLETSDSTVLLQELLPFIMLTDRFTEHSIRESKGSVNPYINWKDIAKYEFPLPPKDEQRRIAEILWAAKECAQTRAQVVSDLTKSWQTLIDNVIPDPDTQSPAHIATLDDVCEMQNGRPFPSKYYSDEGFKLLRPGNLAPRGRIEWSDKATVYLGQEHVDANVDHVVRPGDVVINLTAQSLEEGFMGRVCLATMGDDSLLNQRLGRFVCNGDVSSEYLFRVLQTSRFRRLVESRCEGSKVRHTYFRHFAKMPIVVLDDQQEQEVIERARQIDAARDAAIVAEESSRELLVQLRESLLGVTQKQ